MTISGLEVEAGEDILTDLPENPRTHRGGVVDFKLVVETTTSSGNCLLRS